MVLKGCWRSLAKNLGLQVTFNYKGLKIRGHWWTLQFVKWSNLSKGYICHGPRRLLKVTCKTWWAGDIQLQGIKAESIYKTYPHVISQKITHVTAPLSHCTSTYPPPLPNDEHCVFMSLYIQHSLIRASSLTLPWVIRGSTGYSGAKPGSSMTNLCSSVGHPCLSVTLPGLIRELSGAHPGLDRGSSVTSIPWMSHGRVPEDSRMSPGLPGWAPDGSSGSQSGARAGCIKHFNTSGPEPGPVYPWINPDHPGSHLGPRTGEIWPRLNTVVHGVIPECHDSPSCSPGLSRCSDISYNNFVK